MGWIYSLIAIPVVGFILHYWLAGAEAMNAELHIWLIYGLASAGLVFSILFIWNLYWAPFRIERDRAEDANTKLIEVSRERDELKAIVENPPMPKFTTKLSQLISGGNENNNLYIILILRISNIGNAPSAITDWGCCTSDENGNKLPSKLVHMISTDLPFGDKTVTLDSEFAIYNISATPYAPGDIKEGHIIIEILNSIDLRRTGINIKIIFYDAYGKEHVHDINLPKESGEGELSYVKGMKVSKPI